MFRRLRGSLAREGLPFSRFLVLRLLALRGPTTSKALAKAMGVTTANMPGLIDRLEADGLVTRRQNANDRREILVSVTRTGRQTLARLKESAGTEMIAAFEGWTNAELRTLLDALRRITDGRPGGDLIELNMIR
jgi:DNA-binding MarR family transcriptional regulator